jgi:hypothetical protein
MALLGKVLRRIRAGERRSPLSGTGFDAPQSITVTSSAFTDGGAMPQSSAGQGVGDNTSPPLHWDGLPSATRQVVLIVDDIDVPLPRPLLHTIAVIQPTLDGVAAGSLRPGTAGMRFIRADLGHRGYAGPRPIPGHGPHHYGDNGQDAAGDDARPCPGPRPIDRHLRTHHPIGGQIMTGLTSELAQRSSWPPSHRMRQTELR